jgi:heme/copper-type cytochrome/quinol oxidase subunit 1
MSASEVQDEPGWSSLNLIGRSGAFCAALALLLQCAVADATLLQARESWRERRLAWHEPWSPDRADGSSEVHAVRG